jgi:hypothetical protein
MNRKANKLFIVMVRTAAFTYTVRVEAVDAFEAELKAFGSDPKVTEVVRVTEVS